MASPRRVFRTFGQESSPPTPTSAPPAYQAIASKALQLRELGLSDRVIAARLGVTDKTVAKAIRWLRTTARR
jgi:DNA-binding NarL/FixJ family response regulator